MITNAYDYFREELDLIHDDRLRAATAKFLEDIVPEYFYTVPASSTGKYHPSFDQGEGGLVRHTKMLVAVAQELFRMEDEDLEDIQDYVIIACLLHDTFKNGYTDSGRTVDAHPQIAAVEANKFFSQVNKNEAFLISHAILTHMGKWGYQKPENKIDKMVHLCDYIASRKFFDKFGG